MTYQGWRDADPGGDPIYATYLEKITRFVSWLLDHGHNVRILMGDAADRRAVSDVIRAVSETRPDLPHDRLLTEPSHSLHHLMRQLAETDVVVATRFHNVICALKLGKPTVSIGYGEKNRALMTEMGLGSFCQHVENLNFDLLIQQFTQLISNRQLYEQSIRETNAVYQQRLKQQELLVAARVL
jgi:polysaccharide pyruvyl transferase WcaK-like protein